MYTIFKIPKRNGKFRTIEAPCDSLKAEQQEILKELQRTFKTSPFCHAFQRYKNISTMAMSHVGKEWVGCIDIEDFFPSIKAASLAKELLKQKAAENLTSAHVVSLLAPALYDFGDLKGLRLPQGAPTSPFLSNAYLFSFDWRMAWSCSRLGCDYTRYADDIVISGGSKGNIHALFKVAKNVLHDHYSLKINDSKTKVMGKKQRQLVCGVVVNERLNTKRRWRKNLRAEIYQQKGGELSKETQGRIAFNEMVRENKKTSHSSTAIVHSIRLSRRLEAATR